MTVVVTSTCAICAPIGVTLAATISTVSKMAAFRSLLQQAMLVSALAACASAQALSIQPCTDGFAPENFVVNADQTVTQSGKCVDFDGGNNIVLAACDGSNDQKWTFETDGTVHNAGNTANCWNVDGGGVGAGNPIVMYQCDSVTTRSTTTPEVAGRAGAGVAANDIFWPLPSQTRILANESGLCVSSAAPPPPPCETTFTCCSLNGELDPVTQRCNCYSPWTGDANCSSLSFLPSKGPFSGYGMQPNLTSWGGNMFFYGGQYHMYVAEMANDCSLNEWQQNSQCVHATAPTPEGPWRSSAHRLVPLAFHLHALVVARSPCEVHVAIAYTPACTPQLSLRHPHTQHSLYPIAPSSVGPFKRQGVAIGVFCHNPQVMHLSASESGTGADLFVLFHIGTGTGGNPKNCTPPSDSAVVSFDDAADGTGRWLSESGAGSTLHTASSPTGPWTPVNPTNYPDCNNPSPMLHPNGTWYLLCNSANMYTSSNGLMGPWSHLYDLQPAGGGVSGKWPLSRPGGDPMYSLECVVDATWLRGMRHPIVPCSSTSLHAHQLSILPPSIPHVPYYIVTVQARTRTPSCSWTRASTGTSSSTCTPRTCPIRASTAPVSGRRNVFSLGVRCHVMGTCLGCDERFCSGADHTLITRSAFRDAASATLNSHIDTLSGVAPTVLTLSPFTIYQYRP